MLSTLAIYGGTFDPIHIGHLRAAQEVAEKLALKVVFFMPCAIAPFKKNIYAKINERIEMIRLAIKDNPRFKINELEIHRGGISYTVESLKELKYKYPKNKLCFLVGTDTFFSIHSWYQPNQLFELTDLAIITRSKVTNYNIINYLKQHLTSSFKLAKDGWIRLPNGHGVKLVTTTFLDISSTDIKQRAAKGLSLNYLIPSAVNEYIKLIDCYSKQRIDL